MLETSRINKIAQHLFDCHSSKLKFENLTKELAPSSVSDAYKVQQKLIKLWEHGGRGPVAGYKIALTSKAIQELVGVDKPVGAAIFESTIHQSPAEINLDSYLRLGLEFELAFRMGKDVPINTRYNSNSICDFLDAVMPAFELIEDRDADYSNLDPMTLIADNAWCGGVVLGAPSCDWNKIDLSSTPVSLSFNDSIEKATTGAAMGNPLNSLAWLANLLSEQGRPLKKGDIVMSGSTLATKFMGRDDHAVYAIEGLGSVEIRIK
jgi:2-keto-4-pentenoate hydratase